MKKLINSNIMVTVAVVCLFLTGQIWSQKAPKVGFKTSCVSIVDGKYKLYVPLKPIPKENKEKYDGGWLEVELNIRDAIGGYHVNSHGIIPFFDEKDATKEPIAVVKIRPSNQNMLLLFMPAKKGKYRIMPISIQESPWGSYLLVNMTGDPMMAAIGNQKAKIQKNGRRAFRANGRKSDVAIIAGLEKGKVTVLRETEWALKAIQREIVIYYRDQRSGRIRWKHIMDTKPPKVDA